MPVGKNSNTKAATTSHSAMNHAMVKAMASHQTKGVGVKSQLNSIDTLSSHDATGGNLLTKPKADPVGGKKFSLVPFAKEQSQSSQKHSYKSSTSERAASQSNRNEEQPMEQIAEVPVHAEGAKDGTGKDLALALKEPSDKQEDESVDEDDYEDDNDFEPFETSKKDFYQGDSLDEASAEAKSQVEHQQEDHNQTPMVSEPYSHQANMDTPAAEVR